MSISTNSLLTIILGVAVALFCIVPASSVQGATFEYLDGSMFGQRGTGLAFGGFVENGSYGHYNETPPVINPVTTLLEIDDASVGNAWVSTLQEASVNTSGGNLAVWNHGRVEVQANPIGAQTLQVDRPGLGGASAHSDSCANDLAYKIMPGAGESVGDPVMLVFNADFTVSHHINGTDYNDWTDLNEYHVKGKLDGPYPAPYTVSIRAYDTVRDRPVLHAKEKYTSSAKVFDMLAVQARIGDAVVFRGGVLPWMTIEPVSVSTNQHVVSDMQMDANVQVWGPATPAPGVLTIDSARRHIDGDYLTDSSGEWFCEENETQGSWDMWVLIDDNQAMSFAEQKSEVTEHWLGGNGYAEAQLEVSGGVDEHSVACSLYEVTFNLDEGTEFQLRLLLDGECDAEIGGTAVFELAGPDSFEIRYEKEMDGWWVPHYEEGYMEAGQYHLTVRADAELNGIMFAPGDYESWASFDFDLTFGEAPQIPEPATMSLLALGGLALLRRRRSA